MTGADPPPPGPKPRPTDQGSRTAINGARLSGHRGWPSTPGTGALRSDTTKPAHRRTFWRNWTPFTQARTAVHPSKQHARTWQISRCNTAGSGAATLAPGWTGSVYRKPHTSERSLSGTAATRSPAPQSSRLKAHKTSIRSATNDHVGRPSERADRAVIWSLCRKSTAEQVTCGVYMFSPPFPTCPQISKSGSDKGIRTRPAAKTLSR